MYESNYIFNLAEISLYYSLKICQHDEINNIVGDAFAPVRYPRFGIRNSIKVSGIHSISRFRFSENVRFSENLACFVFLKHPF